MIVLVLIVAVSGCNNSANDPSSVGHGPTNEIVAYGNGVYYFPYIGAKFGNSLSTFLESHTELEVVAMTGNGRGAYGTEIGYFVVFRPKK